LMAVRMSVNESATWNELRHQSGSWFMDLSLQS